MKSKHIKTYQSKQTDFFVHVLWIKISFPQCINEEGKMFSATFAWSAFLQALQAPAQNCSYSWLSFTSASCNCLLCSPTELSSSILLSKEQFCSTEERPRLHNCAKDYISSPYKKMNHMIKSYCDAGELSPRPATATQRALGRSVHPSGVSDFFL